MELKEYFKIIGQNIKLFVFVIVFVVAASFAYFSLKPISHETFLALNVTRSGSQETTDYKFDGFYRLQADEKFAETVVEWLKNPRVAKDIYENAGIDVKKLTLRGLSRSFRAEKLSSQIVSVSFVSENPETAKKISNSVVSVISKNIDNLNKDQKESNWFEIIAGESLTVKRAVSPLIIFVFSLLVGIFLAFWTVLVIHYLR